jgi:hypothetical protein
MSTLNQYSAGIIRWRSKAKEGNISDANRKGRSIIPILNNMIIYSK